MPSDGNSSYRWAKMCGVGRSWQVEHVCSLDLTRAKNCGVGRSWQVEHVCSLDLTSISYSFWNKGRKL
jgi:hypothetical protein